MKELKNWIVTLCIIALFAMTLAGLSNASVTTTQFAVTASRTPTPRALTARAPTQFAKVVPGASSTADLWGQMIFNDGFENPFTPQRRITLPDGTFRTLQQFSNISYGVYPAERPHVNVTTWDGLFAYNNTTSPPVGWPGVGGAAPVLRDFGRYNYIAAHFKTPADIARWNGGFSNPSYIAPPDPSKPTMRLLVTFAISRYPGDFSRGLVTPGCIARNVPASDVALVQWKGTSNAPGSWCNEPPSTDLWVNWIISDPSQCPRPICLTGSVSKHN